MDAIFQIWMSYWLNLTLKVSTSILSFIQPPNPFLKQTLDEKNTLLNSLQCNTVFFLSNCISSTVPIYLAILNIYEVL